MTNQSIRIPNGWTIDYVEGRYEDTQFSFESTAADDTDVFVRFIGATSDNYRAEYHLSVVTGTAVEAQHDYHVTTFYSEADAMQGTQQLMEELTAAIEVEDIDLTSHSSSDLEDFLEQFSPRSRGGWLAMLRTPLCS
jgi:hypothetical protein